MRRKWSFTLDGPFFLDLLIPILRRIKFLVLPGLSIIHVSSSVILEEVAWEAGCFPWKWLVGFLSVIPSKLSQSMGQEWVQSHLDSVGTKCPWEIRGAGLRFLWSEWIKRDYVIQNEWGQPSAFSEFAQLVTSNRKKQWLGFFHNVIAFLGFIWLDE